MTTRGALRLARDCDRLRVRAASYSLLQRTRRSPARFAPTACTFPRAASGARRYGKDFLPRHAIRRRSCDAPRRRAPISSSCLPRSQRKAILIRSISDRAEFDGSPTCHRFRCLRLAALMRRTRAFSPGETSPASPPSAPSWLKGISASAEGRRPYAPDFVQTASSLPVGSR